MPDIIPFNAENNLTVDGTTATIDLDARIATDVWLSEYMGWVTPKAFRQIVTAAGKDIDTWVIRILSPGGSADAGAAIASAIRKLGEKSKTIAAINAAGSAATFLALACQEVTIARNGHFFIHQASGYVEGRESFVRSYADRIANLNAEMVTLYAEKSGQSEDDIKAWMDKETWFNGTKAVELGFCDALSDPVQGLDAFKPESAAGDRLQDDPTSPLYSLCCELKAQRHQPAEDPATETEDDDMAATLKELKAALPKADSDFLVAQLEAEADVPTATAAWADHLQAKLDAAEDAKAAAEKAATDAEAKAAEAAAKATQQKPGSKGVTEASGGDADADADDDEQQWDDPTAEWRKRLEKKLDRGTPRSEAVSQLKDEEPELYAAYLGQHESRMNRNRSRGNTRRVAR